MSIIEKALDRFDNPKPEGVIDHPTLAQQRIQIDTERFCGLDDGPVGGVLPYLADEYRRIKRPLLSNAFGKHGQRVKNGNLILITSALPGEGKSFTTTNLALSMATERDRTVLLVDCDVTKSRVTRLAGLGSRKGFVDLLLDESLDVSEVLVKTNFPRLNIIPSGGAHPHINELFASEHMGRILEEIASRYSNRIILFDAPPLLVTPETQILCDHMGQVVMVVAMGVTPKHIVNQALSMVSSENRPTGLVLNKASRLSGTYGYGAGAYGYGADT